VGVWCFCQAVCLNVIFPNMCYGLFWCFLQDMILGVISMLCKDLPGSYYSYECHRRCVGLYAVFCCYVS